jgi:hypothetical protein
MTVSDRVRLLDEIRILEFIAVDLLVIFRNIYGNELQS